MVDLVAGKVVNANISYDFKAGIDFEKFKGLGGKRNAYMTVSSYYYGGLKIVVKENQANHVRNSDVTLYCRIDNKKGDSELRLRSNSEKLFYGSVELDNTQKTLSLNSWNGSLKVSLYNCPSTVKDAENTICELRVSDLSSWNWNTRVNATAKFETLSVQAK